MRLDKFYNELKKRLKIPSYLHPFLPRRYELVGDIAILYLKPEVEKYKLEIAKILKELIGVRSVYIKKGIKGEFRRPEMERVLGDTSITLHKYYGVKFWIDVEKIMWSKGNMYERKRIADLCKGEKVLDMFAGIGYFSLLASKKAKEVWAIEKNPYSFKFLLKNIAENKIKNIVPILSDNRKIKGDIGKFDRIIMGYLPDSIPFLPHALKYINNGWIHIMFVCKKEELDKKIEEIKKYVDIKEFKVRKVKSFAPYLYHFTVDILI